MKENQILVLLHVGNACLFVSFCIKRLLHDLIQPLRTCFPWIGRLQARGKDVGRRLPNVDELGFPEAKINHHQSQPKPLQTSVHHHESSIINHLSMITHLHVLFHCLATTQNHHLLPYTIANAPACEQLARPGKNGFRNICCCNIIKSGRFGQGSKLNTKPENVNAVDESHPFNNAGWAQASTLFGWPVTTSRSIATPTCNSQVIIKLRWTSSNVGFTNTFNSSNTLVYIVPFSSFGLLQVMLLIQSSVGESRTSTCDSSARSTCTWPSLEISPNDRDATASGGVSKQ